MKVFLQVAKTGSFSGAGRVVGMTPSSTAKLISRIEGRLGVRLIERSTRRLRLTAEGELYRERAEGAGGRGPHRARPEALPLRRRGARPRRHRRGLPQTGGHRPARG
ncbi:helix-turn-helix domain-containing protein [Archangium violaceum]|uniref:helix-turn-helix domain-containing protein n=1 Tax=Archangium violaceum TaxID=83451 RepID=UPI001EEFE0DE|nr:LysR family transcriptional regulator [Archangium violaceum]